MWVIDTISAGTTHRSISRIKHFVQGCATPKPLSFEIQNQSEKKKKDEKAMLMLLLLKFALKINI